MRKRILVRNNDAQYTDVQVPVNLNYESGMANNFDDLRFTNEAGDQDLPYYILYKADGTVVKTLVKVPVLDPGETNIYVYYGNGSAPSASSKNDTMDFSDHFAEYAGDFNNTPYWGGCGGVQFTNEDVAQIPLGCAIYTKNPYDRQDVSSDRVSEYEVSKDLSGVTDCNGYGGANYEKLTNDITQGDPDSFFTGNNVAQSSGCSDKKWSVNQIGITHQNGYRSIEYNQATVQKFDSNQFYRFRLVNHAAGGVSFYYSLDGGNTYIEYQSFPNNNLQQLTSFLFTTDQLPEQVRNVYTYRTGNFYSVPQVPEYLGGRIGDIISPIIDMGDSPYFGKVLLQIQNIEDGGNAFVKIQTSNESDMGSSTSLDYCGYANSDTDISAMDCVSPAQRYLRYQIILSDNSSNDIAVGSITLEHDNDAIAPDAPGSLAAKESPSGKTLADNSWMRAGVSPYFSWNAADDNVGGSGVVGYCMYFGTDANADTSSSGLLTGNSIFNANGICEQATTSTNFNSSSDRINTGSLNNGSTYYFRVRAFDRTGNLSEVSTTRIRYDSVNPEQRTLITVPSAVNSAVFKVSWIGGLGNDPFIDTGSGVAGIKYCVTSLVSGLSGCGADDNNWFGPNHGSGSVRDTSDVFDMHANELTTSELDAPRLDDTIIGYNAIAFAIVDNAGNFQTTSNGPPHNFSIQPCS